MPLDNLHRLMDALPRHFEQVYTLDEDVQPEWIGSLIGPLLPEDERTFRRFPVPASFYNHRTAKGRARRS